MLKILKIDKNNLRKKIDRLKKLVRRDERLNVIKEVIKIINDAQAELDTDPAECEGACWAVLEETKQKVFKLTEANND